MSPERKTIDVCFSWQTSSDVLSCSGYTALPFSCKSLFLSVGPDTIFYVLGDSLSKAWLWKRAQSLLLFLQGLVHKSFVFARLSTGSRGSKSGVESRFHRPSCVAFGHLSSFRHSTLAFSPSKTTIKQCPGEYPPCHAVQHTCSVRSLPLLSATLCPHNFFHKRDYATAGYTLLHVLCGIPL